MHCRDATVGTAHARAHTGVTGFTVTSDKPADSANTAQPSRNNPTGVAEPLRPRTPDPEPGGSGAPGGTAQF